MEPKSPQESNQPQVLPPFDPLEAVEVTDQLYTSPSSKERLNQYYYGERIGGSQRQDSDVHVHACRDESMTGYPLAVKSIRKFTSRDKQNRLRRYVAEDDNTLWSIRREIAIMKRCRHANIVRLVEVIDDPAQEKIYLIMEYLAGGPIHWQTPKDTPLLKLNQTRRIVRDAMLGLEYLHHEGIIHRDIKPANLLYTRDRRTVKIVDFGVAHYVPTHRMRAKGPTDVRPDTVINQELFPMRNLLRTQGTPMFLAPEVLDETLKAEAGDNARQFLSYDTISAFEPDPVGSSSPLKRRPPLTTAIDVWALGITFYCCLFGHVPYTGDQNRFTLNDHILKNNFKIDASMGYEKVPTGGRNPTDENSEGWMVVRLLEKILEKDPSKRITISMMKEHPWFLHDIQNPQEWLRLTAQPYTEKETTEKPTWIKITKKKILGRIFPARS